MPRKKDPVHRIIDLYIELNPEERLAVKNMIYGFEKALFSEPTYQRSSRRKPMAPAASAEPNSITNPSNRKPQ